MRDISLEMTILKILDRLCPTPLRDSILCLEVEIALDRPLVTTDFLDALQSLQARKLINRNSSRFGLPQCFITEAGRAALNQ